MLRRGRERHIEARRELAHRLVAGRESAQNLAAHGMSERSKRGIELGLMVNHVV
jgi:hypothetical protein